MQWAKPRPQCPKKWTKSYRWRDLVFLSHLDKATFHHNPVGPRPASLCLKPQIALDLESTKTCDRMLRTTGHQLSTNDLAYMYKLFPPFVANAWHPSNSSDLESSAWFVTSVSAGTCRQQDPERYMLLCRPVAMLGCDRPCSVQGHPDNNKLWIASSDIQYDKEDSSGKEERIKPSKRKERWKPASQLPGSRMIMNYFEKHRLTSNSNLCDIACFILHAIGCYHPTYPIARQA